jgi:hypothetical protein
MPNQVDLTFPHVCHECGLEIAADELRTLVVRAGNAWEDGVAVLAPGRSLFVTEAYHEGCAPSEEATP